MLAGLTICRYTSLKFTYTHTHATHTCTHIHVPQTQQRRTQDVPGAIPRRYKHVRKYNTERTRQYTLTLANYAAVLRHPLRDMET
jgi:hypothetical protein